jgi:CD36 family.
MLLQIYRTFKEDVTVFIGPNSTKNFFTMDNYNGRNRFGYWPNVTCDSVKLSTEGVLYHQRISKDDKLLFFRKTICRAVTLVYESKCVMYGTEYLFCPKNIVHRFPLYSTARVSGRMSETRVRNKCRREVRTAIFQMK